MIEDSVRYLKAQGREVVYDAEHFFDGYMDNPQYALRTLEAAARAALEPVALRDQRREAGPPGPVDRADIVARFGAGLVGIPLPQRQRPRGRRHLGRGRRGRHLGPGHRERLRRARRQRTCDHSAHLALKMGCTMTCSRIWRSCGTFALLDELANLRPNPRPVRRAVGVRPQGGSPRQRRQKVARSYEHIDPTLVGTAPGSRLRHGRAQQSASRRGSSGSSSTRRAGVEGADRGA